MKVWAGRGFIDIKVGDGFVAEFVGELCSPLGGAGEADFLSVPTTKDQRALGACSCFRQLSQGAGHFHQRGGAAAGIDSAKHPSVAMIAEDDPLVGQLRATNA